MLSFVLLAAICQEHSHFPTVNLHAAKRNSAEQQQQPGTQNNVPVLTFTGTRRKSRTMAFFYKCSHRSMETKLFIGVTTFSRYLTLPDVILLPGPSLSLVFITFCLQIRREMI